MASPSSPALYPYDSPLQPPWQSFDFELDEVTDGSIEDLFLPSGEDPLLPAGDGWDDIDLLQREVINLLLAEHSLIVAEECERHREIERRHRAGSDRRREERLARPRAEDAAEDEWLHGLGIGCGTSLFGNLYHTQRTERARRNERPHDRDPRHLPQFRRLHRANARHHPDGWPMGWERVPGEDWARDEWGDEVELEELGRLMWFGRARERLIRSIRRRGCDVSLCECDGALIVRF